MGYDRENILMFSTDSELAGYSKERTLPVYREIAERVAALPGVQSSAASVVRPVDEEYYLVDMVRSIDGRMLQPQSQIKVAWNAVSPGYFATLEMPIVLGRDFNSPLQLVEFPFLRPGPPSLGNRHPRAIHR